MQLHHIGPRQMKEASLPNRKVHTCAKHDKFLADNMAMVQPRALPPVQTAQQ